MKPLIVCALLFAMVISTPAHARRLEFGTVKVYTRNLYVGTDFTPVFAALQDPQSLVSAARAALEEIARTNFPQRAEALADEIASVQPHLIGLQEVFNFTLNGAHSAPPFVDYLETLLAALAARGLEYRVAAVVNNIALTFTIDLFPVPAGPEVIQVADRDVILARADVATTVAALPCASPLDDPADDGCNYTVLLPLPSPAAFPDSFVFRGFVGVDAVVDRQIYRFVNTHLEVREVGGQDIRAIQQAQAVELVGTIGLATPPQRPVILVGDFNSAPTDPDGSAYDIIRIAAYTDTWTRNVFRSLIPHGFTCCQDGDLNNAESRLDERIDLIFVKNNLGILPFSFTGQVFAVVLGDEPISDTQPRWSSDHAGPFAVLHGMPVFEQHGSPLQASTPGILAGHR